MKYKSIKKALLKIEATIIKDDGDRIKSEYKSEKQNKIWVIDFYGEDSGFASVENKKTDNEIIHEAYYDYNNSYEFTKINQMIDFIL